MNWVRACAATRAAGKRAISENEVYYPQKFSLIQRWIVATYSAITLTLAAEVVAGSFCPDASFSKISPHTGIFDSPCAPIRVLPSIVAITFHSTVTFSTSMRGETIPVTVNPVCSVILTEQNNGKEKKGDRLS